MLMKQDRQFKGLPMEPTPSEIFRQHLDELIPTDDKIIIDENSKEFKEKVERYSKENMSRLKNSQNSSSGQQKVPSSKQDESGSMLQKSAPQEGSLYNSKSIHSSKRPPSGKPPDTSYRLPPIAQGKNPRLSAKGRQDSIGRPSSGS